MLARCDFPIGGNRRFFVLFACRNSLSQIGAAMTKTQDRIRLRSAITVVEMLIVLSILLGLIAILMPAVQQARMAAQRTQCTSNIRQLCLGMNQYLELRSFPNPAAEDVAGGWSVRVLCYLDEEPLMQLIDGVHLEQIPATANQRPRVLSCPTNPAEESVFPPFQTGHYASTGYSITDLDRKSVV